MDSASKDIAEAGPARTAGSAGSGKIAHSGKRLPGRWRRRPKITKIGPVGAFLRPVGWGLAILLCTYGLVSLGSSFWRSWQRHQEFTAAAHPDQSTFDIFFKSSIPKNAVDLVVRDVDGQLRRVVARKSDADDFVNETILMLDTERDRIKKQANDDVDQLFNYAFADRKQAVDGYADWFFEWKRSYIVLKETLTAAVTRFAQSGQYESLTEAVERDLKDYFMRHYNAQVLKPEVRDQVIATQLETAVRRAHENYRRVIANGDMRLQLFLARNTRHLEDVPADRTLSTARLDWDAQKWKAPVYLMEDRAFDGVAGIGYAAAGGTVGALALGPVMNRVMVRSFGLLSRRFVTAFGARLALAEQGAVAGTLVEPVGGTVAGAITGVLIGVAADYFINEADEKFNRDKFIAANNDALDTTIDIWKKKLKANVNGAIDRWFDDARAAVVLARKQTAD